MAPELANFAKHRYEFKKNHGEWVSTVKPDLGPGISERVWEAIRTTDENVDVCHSVKTELRAALNALLGVLSLSMLLNASTKLGLSTWKSHNPTIIFFKISLELNM